MTWRYDQSPGSDVTLLALYDAVVAAEEFDLGEQARADAYWAEIHILYGLDADDDRGDVDEAIEAERVDDPDRPRMSQVVGLVEHLLGGHWVADD
jgi:hypothetical protein